MKRIPDTLRDLAIDITHVVEHPENARRHDLEAIQTSLFVNGQFRPIVANRRTKHVLAGNGTLAAAKALGWDRIAVTWVSIPAEKEARILLADNRIAERGGYVHDQLLDLLRQVEDEPVGSGFTDAEIDRLLAPADPPAKGGKVATKNGQVRTLYRCPKCSHEWTPGVGLPDELLEADD